MVTAKSSGVSRPSRKGSRMRRLLLTSLVALAALMPSLARAEEGLTPMQQFGPAVPVESFPCRTFFPSSPTFVDFGTIDGEPVTGHMAVPSAFGPATDTLVVFFHGYSHLSDSWKTHIAEAAARGMTAIAVDYRGHRTIDGFDRGWEVFNGAEDGILAAKAMMARCPGFKKVVAFGVSMGGNSSGIAVADAGSPFDYWFDVEGATNIIEESTAARAAAPSGPFVANADADIVAGYDGRIEENPGRYAEGAVVTRAGDMKAAGLKGAFVVHGVDDGLVPYNQAVEMTAALLAAQIPTESYQVVTRGTQEAGTTATGTALDPVMNALGIGYESPFAGHASEASTTHRVMRVALDRLATLANGSVPHLGTSFVPLP